jgi:hypothetical protein
VDESGRETILSVVGLALFNIGLMIIISAGVGDPAHVMNQFQVFFANLKTLWGYFGFGLGMGLAGLKCSGDLNALSAVIATLTAARGAIKVAAEEGVTMAMLPGGQRLAQAAFGYVVACVGLFLWIEDQ